MSLIEEKTEAKRKQTLRKLGLAFICIMGLLTFLSKTIHNFTLPEVITEYGSSGILMRTATADGMIQAKESRYEYKPNMIVKEIKCKTGDRVSLGQTIMILRKQASEIEETEEELTVVETKLKSAEIELEKLQRDYEKRKKLYEAGADTLVNLQDAQYDVALKLAEVNNLKEELENLRSQEDQYIVQADCQGIIKGINYKEGSITDNSTPLCVIANIEKGFECKTSVNTDIAEYLTLGDTADVYLRSGGERFKGVIEKIEGNEQQQGKVKDVYIAVEKGGLSGGESVQVYINKEIGFFDLIISNNSVNTDIEGKYVWVVREKKGPLGNEFYLVKTDIVIGENDDYKTSVLSGISCNDQIVFQIEGNRTVSDGSRVKIIDPGAKED